MNPKIFGVTGSIGMGKSHTAGLFARAGLPLYDADAAVHKLYAAGGAAVAPVSKAFPMAADASGGIDRQKLARHLLAHASDFAQLEKIVHPLVAQDRLAFLAAAQKQGAPAVVFDIPLLLEKGGRGVCDYVIVASAPLPLQKQRVLQRAGMDEEKFRQILARQMPDEEKRRLADFVIDTGRGFAHAEQQVAEVLRQTGIKT